MNTPDTNTAVDAADLNNHIIAHTAIIQAAVDAGDITAEQALAHLTAYIISLNA